MTSTTVRVARTAAKCGGRGGIGDTAHARGVESRLVGPEGEDGGQAGQPGQRGGEEGEAAGVGPLQVVDHEHGAVADGGREKLDAAREDERATGLAVESDVGAVDLGQEDGQRGADPRREPGGEVRVEGERLAQHRARQPPGLVPLGQEGTAGEQRQGDVPGRLRHEPRLACTGDTAERHHVAGDERGPQPRELPVATDEGQTRRTSGPARPRTARHQHGGAVDR